MKTFLSQFREQEHVKLYEVIKEKMLFDKKKSEEVVYAIYQISEHIERIYLQLIPEMINNDNLLKEKLNETFDEIKFNFNEIRQLIETSKLTGLKYWDNEDN